MVMDPWISQDTREVAQGESSSFNGNLGTSDSLPNNLATSSPDQSATSIRLQTFFEDNFQPQPLLDSQNQQPFAKLPDSQEYLASLENKLSVIQKGGKKGATASSILESLNQVRESCMVKLLSNSVNQDQTQEEFSSDEVKVNPLLKKIAPEKQAISVEELVHLLKADQLDILNSESTAAAAAAKTLEESSKENLSENQPPSNLVEDTRNQKLE